MNGLRAELMRHVPSSDGPQADVLVIEPTGEEHQLRCLCKADGTTDLDVIGGSERLTYMEDKYGSQVIWALTRQITLGT